MRFFLCSWMLTLLCLTAGGQARVVEAFKLRNIDGKWLAPEDFPHAKGFIIVFTCNHCPFAKLYPPRLNALNKKYSPLGVPLLAINSMDSVLYEEEEFSRMKQKAKKESFNFSYLQDADQSVGKSFGAEHTPQAFVVWVENGKLVVKYEGAIDDNGEDAEKANPYVAVAVDELLAGKPVTTPKTESFGCRIFYRK